MEHHPDGICLDPEGAVWYADVGTGLVRRVREGGQVLSTIQLDRGALACVLGGADRRTLFVVTNEWGEAGPDPAVRRGQAVVVTAPAAGAGRP